MIIATILFIILAVVNKELLNDCTELYWGIGWTCVIFAIVETIMYVTIIVKYLEL